MFVDLLAHVGEYTISLCRSLGRFSLFFVQAVKTLCGTKLKVAKTIEQMSQIGVDSFPIVFLTGSFAGMVFALQTYVGFQRVGGEQYIGAVVALGMIRELGPVLTGLMVIGRAGSAIAAEIGTMKITEQIDALSTLRINALQYLVIPRMIASTFILPFLTLFAMALGIVGGYIVCVYVIGLNAEDYETSIRTFVELSDIRGGLIKALFFGLLFSWVSTYKGFYTSGGARGVGIATTQAVVAGSVLVLAANYFITKLLEQL